MQTIFALATAQGKAGVAIVRMSGPDAWDVASRYCELPEPRRAGLRRLRDQGSVLDDALVLCFPAGASFTGEPVVEFHVHGSAAIVRALLESLGRQEETRLAEAGEFTRRALDNGRLDLTQTEALNDLLAAETEAQRRQAMRGFSGGLKKAAEHWRMDLLRSAALLEATIDFADEEVPEDVSDEVVGLLSGTMDSMDQEISGYSAATRVKDGFEIAIVGAPNAGKSTLLNALAGREAAITSDVAGTTRDIVEVRLEIGGVPVTFLDTAGIRETKDDLESKGIERAKVRANAADLRVFLSCTPGDVGLESRNDDILVTGKGDLSVGAEYPVSGLTGLGLDRLLLDLSDKILESIQGAGLVTHERQRQKLLLARSSLSVAFTLVAQGGEVYDIAAEEIRIAVRAMESLMGKIDVEQVLGEIFSQFCVGK